jgi:hypothetical protein
MSKVVSMSVGAIDPITQTKRVFWRPATATTVAKVGQPVSYNIDLAGDHKERSTDPTASHLGGGGTTYAEGSQTYTGRLFCVEEVKVDDSHAFAGFIKSLGPNAGADGDMIEIFVPSDNGMVVPVYTDKSIAIRDSLYLEDGENTVVNATQVGMGPQVGIAIETIDRSSTAGLVWAKVFMPKQDGIYPGTLGIAPSELLWRDCPWDAIARNPGIGITYFDDFMSDHNPTTAEGWTITQVTTGTLGLVAAEGGELKADSAGSTSADDGVQAQLLNCRFLPAAGKTIWFEARVKMNDATDQYFVGLAATDTTLIASGVIDDVSDKCGFFHHAASTDNKISSITARAAADDATADVADNTDGTYMTVGFRITGLTTVEFYVNGALVETGSTAANIPNAAMCLSLVSQIEGTGADAELSVDWVKIAQLGARA